jgi:dTMP kinase
MLIVIEGIDGSGKDTLADALAKELGAHRFSFPDYTTPLGECIHEHLRGFVTHGVEVFQAMQIANKLEHIQSLQESHDDLYTTVLTRYWQSAVVYGQIDGIDPNWSTRVCSVLPRAQMNILVDIETEEALRRQANRGLPLERYEGQEETMRAARAGYLALWGRNHGPRWPIISSFGSPEETLAQAMKAIGPYITPRRYQ